ncbi:MAG: PQQ-binding-like beta-propeller repeat protein [Bacteroidota bacterium]
MNTLKIMPLCLVLFCRCQKNEDAPPTQTGPVLYWKHDFNTPQLTGSQTPILTSSGVLFSLHTDQNSDESLLMLDPETGLTRWTWNQYLNHPTTILAASRQEPALYNQDLLFAAGNGLYNIDLSDGHTVLKQPGEFNSAYKQLGASILCTQNRLQDTVTQVALIDMMTGNERFLYTHHGLNSAFNAISCPTYAFESNGDTSLYWMYKTYNHQSWKTEASMYALRLPDRQMRFIKSNISQGSNEYAPLVRDSLIFVEGYREVLAMNRFTGAEIWRTQTGGVGGRQIQIIDQILLVSDADHGFLIGLEPKTGVIRWKTQVYGACSMPQYMDGVLYTISQENGKLYAIQITDGSILWTLESPDLALHPYATFSYGVGVDPVNRRVFLSSFRAAYCYKI